MTEFFDNSRHYIDIYNGDCVEVMDKLISDGITVDLTVTSPPYDDLRTYNGYSFEFEDHIIETPKTGDEGHIRIWFAVLGISLVAFLGAIMYFKKFLEK